MTEFGYAGEILKVDLSTRQTSKLTSSQYTDRFLGGKGLAVKLYWDMVPPQAKAFDPENCLICTSGPVVDDTGSHEASGLSWLWYRLRKTCL